MYYEKEKKLWRWYEIKLVMMICLACQYQMHQMQIFIYDPFGIANEARAMYMKKNVFPKN